MCPNFVQTWEDDWMSLQSLLFKSVNVKSILKVKKLPNLDRTEAR